MKRHKLIVSLLFTIILFTFSSCFEIVEELRINANGSGNIQLTFNFSQSKTKLASLMKLDSVNGYKVPSKAELQAEMQNIQRQLKAIPGISNVKHQLNFDQFIGTLSFDFTDVKLVNKATQIVATSYKIKNASLPNYSFNKDLQQLVRTYATNNVTLQNFKKLKKEDKEVFNSAQLTSIIRFQKNIIKSSNANAVIAKNKQAVMQKVPILSLIQNQHSINQTILLQQ